MDITTERAGDTAVVALSGELDASNYETLIDTARRLRGEGAKRLVVDMSGLTYMGSAGLVALHSMAAIIAGGEPPDPEAGWQAIHDVGASVSGGQMQDALRLAGPPPSVDRVLERTGLKGIFSVHPDRQSALDASA